MFRISVIFFIVYHLTTATSTPQLTHKSRLFNLNKHVQLVAQFPCGVPQPKVYSVSDILSGSDIKGKAYYPDVTVLHRCENTGCCISGQVCGPKFVETVNLPFKVTYLEDYAQHRIGSWIMKYREVENHTECHCVNRPSPSTQPSLFSEDRLHTDPGMSSISSYMQKTVSQYVQPSQSTRPNQSTRPSKSTRTSQFTRPSFISDSRIHMSSGMSKASPNMQKTDETRASPTTQTPQYALDIAFSSMHLPMESSERKERATTSSPLDHPPTLGAARGATRVGKLYCSRLHALDHMVVAVL